MNEESIVFPKVFRGYDRKSVNDFILRSNRDFSKESGELKEQIEELSRTVDEKTAECDSLAETVGALREEIASRDKKIEELDGRVGKADADAAARVEQIEKEHDEMLAEHTVEIRELREELALVSSQRDELLVEKRREEEYRKNGLEADLRAYREEIAAQLRVLTKKCLKEVISGLNGIRDDLNVISESADVRTTKMIDSINTYEDEMKEEVRKILADFIK